jgi:geranylgeranyl pyrophosphate synthase
VNTFRTLDALRSRVNAGLEAGLPASAPAPILAAMKYSLIAGGKRFRPVLALAVAEAVAARDGRSLDDALAAAMPGACALEYIHTYSLIHDDLPAMDNDMLRRGRPTTHVVHGDGLAVLAGDGLLTQAFWLLATAQPADAALAATRLVAEAAGADGMVGGQAVDLVAAGRVPSFPAAPLSDNELNLMHYRKTAALISAAAGVGAILSGGDEATCAHVNGYAADVGLAFQIIDDVLDVEASSAELGKTAGKDAVDDKPTFVSQFGVDGARHRARACIDRAKQCLADARLDGRLPEIAEWTISRKS